MELETENVLLKCLYKSVVNDDKQSKLCTLTTLKRQLYKSMGMTTLPTNSKKKFYCTLRHTLRTSFGEYCMHIYPPPSRLQIGMVETNFEHTKHLKHQLTMNHI